MHYKGEEKQMTEKKRFKNVSLPTSLYEKGKKYIYDNTVGLVHKH